VTSFSFVNSPQKTYTIPSEYSSEDHHSETIRESLKQTTNREQSSAHQDGRSPAENVSYPTCQD
jgi:hypothetical protein